MGAVGLLATVPDYEEALRHLEMRAILAQSEVAVERSRGEAQWALLEKLPQERRLLLIKSDRRFQHWGLFSKVLARARSVGRKDPIAAVDLAELALALAELLDPEHYGAERIEDFRAAALGALGNAKRLASDFTGAAAAFRKAREALEAGTGDLLERAGVISFEASLLTDLGSLEEAVALLDEAIACYQRLGERHLEGRILLQQASAIGLVDPRRGISLAEEGLFRIDPDRDPHLELCGRHILAYCHNEIGETGEALAILETYQYLYARYQDPVTQGRFFRLEALIARQLGDFHRAEAIFRNLRDLYSSRGFHFDTVLTSLDLGEVLMAGRRWKDAEEVLEETYPALEAWGLEQDLLAAWLMLQDAVRARTAETHLFKMVQERLLRGWNSGRKA